MAGVQVVTEKVWDYATEYDLPRAFVINWMDRELANFDRAMESITHVFGRNVVPLQLPIGAEKEFSRRGGPDHDEGACYTRRTATASPRSKKFPPIWPKPAKTAHETLVEMVAEGDDALMEEFFEKGTLPVEDLMKGLRDAFQAKRIYPVVLSSALHNIGSDTLLDLLVDVFPRPVASAARPSGTARPASKGRRSAAKDRRHRTAFDFCVQDAGRSLRRTHQLFQGDVRRAEERRDAAEFHARHAASACSTSR